jgi:uncharacterized Zn finger protein (UPF0148 family)
VLCSKCGNDLFDFALFCPQCGKANEICILEKKGVLALSEIHSKEEKELERRFEFIHIKLSDHAFHNDKHMQNILRQIKMRENEYKSAELALQRHSIGSGSSIYVYANSQPVGYVPFVQVKYLLDHWNRIDRISDYTVFGGTQLFHSQRLARYGVEITVRLYKKIINMQENNDAYAFYQKTS